MSNVLRLAIVDPNDHERESLKSMLLGMDMIWLEAECSRYEFFADVVAQTSPDIGLVAIDADPQKGLDLVAQLGTTSPNSPCSSSARRTTAADPRGRCVGGQGFLTLPLRIEDLLRRSGRSVNAAAATATRAPAAAR